MPKITPLQFLHALYPEPFTEGQLVIWTKTRQGGTKQTAWLKTVKRAAELGRKQRRSRDVYFGVALQSQEAAVAIARRRRSRATARSVRGSEASATLLPALWADIDIAGPGHANDELPPNREAALSLLSAVPKPPSIVVDSGGGFHLYWLLDKALRLADRADRTAAKNLVRRLQGALRSAASDRGWTVDNTANLAQLLRLPGTLNHKMSRARSVSVEHFPLPHQRDTYLYLPEDFDSLPELPSPAANAAPLLRRRPRDAGPPANFGPVFDGCGWIRHCYEDRTSLPEPEWYAALSIVGRCAVGGADGRRRRSGAAFAAGDGSSGRESKSSGR